MWVDVLLAGEPAGFESQADPPLDLLRLPAESSGAEGHLGFDRTLEELVVRILKGVADHPRHERDRHLRDLRAGHCHTARSRPQQAVEKLCKSRLAGTVLAHQRHCSAA